MPQLLIESSPIRLSLEEAKGGKLIARGEFGRVGVPTQNGRIYPEELMQREITRLLEDIQKRRVLGELDHPSDGKTSLKRVSHVITGLKIKNGIVEGEAEILNTPEGKTLKALIEANVQLGVSSRGYGSTQPSSGKEEGEVVQDDFVLKTWDFVAEPAMKTAVPGIFTEDIDDPTHAEMFLAEFPEVADTIKASVLEEAKKTGDKGLDEAVKAAEEKVRRELAENFERKLAEELLGLREDVAKELREEFSNDPEVGGAKAVLAQIAEVVAEYRATPDERAVTDAIKAKDLEVAEVRQERDDAATVAKKAAMSLHIERKIGKHPMADAIRKLLDGKVFESTDQADEALAAILKDLPEQEPKGTVREEEAKLREENAELRGEITLLTGKVETLDGKLSKAVLLGERIDEQREAAALRAEEAEAEAAKKIAEAEQLVEEAHDERDQARLEAYKHEKVVGLPNGREVLALLENVDSRAAVDRLVAEKGSTGVSDGVLQEQVENLRRGKTGRSLNEERPAIPSGPSKDDLGQDMADMRRLAGIEGEQA
jgi:hypothetical protein